MRIDSLVTTDVYVEVRKLQSIIVSSEVNKDGVLEEDAKGNKLITDIDSGYTPLNKLITNYWTGDIMFHNITSGQVVFASRGGVIDMDCDFEKGIRYYLDAEIVTSSKRNGSVFEIDLKGKNIFKVILSGREISNYTITDGGILLQGNEVYMLDNFSTLIVYIYSHDKVPQEHEGLLFEIYYSQYDKIWVWGEEGEEGFLAYLEDVGLLEVNNFTSLSVTPNVTKSGVRTPFKGVTKTIINSIDNSVTLETFYSETEIPIPKFVGSSEFRILLSNPSFGRCVIINNCKLDSSEAIVYDKERNSLKMTIPCGNYIDVQLAEGYEYGMNLYSNGIYGKKSNVYNSHRG